MKSFIEQARVYYGYHTKAATRYTHFVGVPLVIISMMILTGFVQIVITGVLSINFAQILTALMMLYYFRLNWRLALVALPIFVLMLWISYLFSFKGPTDFALWTFLITFIAGWTLQIAGHIIEGKRPALVDNLWQALIAPLFLIAEVFFMWGKMSKLQKLIEQPTELGQTQDPKVEA